MKKVFYWLLGNRKLIILFDAALMAAVAVLFFSAAAPEKPSGIQIAKSTYSTASLMWDKAANAKNYRVYRSEDGKEYKFMGVAAENKYTDKKLRTGKTYFYTVRSQNGIKTSELDTAVYAEVTPELQEPGLSIDTSKGEVELSISEVDGAAGYQIFRNGKEVGKTADTAYVDKTAKGDEEYNYEVKAYRYREEPVYSEASNVVKAELHPIYAFTIEPSGSDLEILWEESDHYSKYKLYNGDELLDETHGNSFTIADCELSKIYDLKLIGYDEGETVQSPEISRRFEVTEEPMDNEAARKAACDWGVNIANDNTFTYGTGERAHREGCYFCGTNTGPNANKKGKSLVKGHSYTKTYCCNPFVNACYAHGAGDEKLLQNCRNANSIDMSEGSYTRLGCFRKIGKPSIADLQMGDVLVASSHVMLYIGDGQIVHAGRSGWDAGSISVAKCSSFYGMVKFVMRYTGDGSGTMRVIKDVEEDGNQTQSKAGGREAE